MHPHSLDPTTTDSITLVLPAWNEREIIAAAVVEADTALRRLTDRYEIIVVDDGSTDGTAATVDRLCDSYPAVRLVRHGTNQGYGAALRSGFAAARMQLVAFTDADCQFDLQELDRFVLLSRSYDVVCGYRIDRQDSALRCLYSKAYNLLVRALLRTGVRDVDCALKMFHRDVVQQLDITGDGFLVNSELLVQAHQQGRSVVEVGVSHRPRNAGSSTVSVRHIPQVLGQLVRYWWNAVQFPTLPPATSSQLSIASARRYGHWQIALFTVAALFLLSNLGYPLIDRDETRYAEIPREMLATGNWVLPQLNFETYYDKPPLLYWLCAISYRCFGVQETSARLIPALAALGMVSATMFFGSRLFDRKIGLLSAAVLLLSLGFTFTSRYLLLDGVLSLLVMVSLLAAYEAMHNERLRIRWWLLSALCCGLGILTKGPLALVLWLPPVYAIAWLSESVAKPRWRHYGIYAAVVALVTMPWLVAVTRQDPDFLYQFLYQHNVARFAGDFHDRPIWYFLPVLLIAGHPWSFLAIPYARFLFGRNRSSGCRRPPAIGFLLLWSVWCFVFFSASRCKLPTYLLPAAPALALMIGHYLSQLAGRNTDSAMDWLARDWSPRSANVATALAGVGFVAFALLTIDKIATVGLAWGLLWTGVLIGTLTWGAGKQRPHLAWISTACLTFLLAVMVMHQLLPAYSRSRTLFGGTSPLGQKLADQNQPPLATVNHEFSGVPFYLNRNDIANFADAKDDGLRRFVANHPHCFLITADRVSEQQLYRNLPRRCRLTELGQRGPGRLYAVETPAIAERVAQRGELDR